MITITSSVGIIIIMEHEITKLQVSFRQMHQEEIIAKIIISLFKPTTRFKILSQEIKTWGLTKFKIMVRTTSSPVIQIR
jgi:hypothetical protein